MAPGKSDIDDDHRSCARHPKLVGELGGRVASAHESDCAHARRNRGAYTERRILDDDAVGGSCTDRASRKEVEIGGGLAMFHLFGTENTVAEQFREARHFERQLEPFSRG